ITRLFIYYEKSANKDILICEIFITGKVNYTHTSFITHTRTPFKRFLHNTLKMSFARLLLEVSEDRKLFVWKVYSEMNNNAIANAHGSRENKKTYFLQLVEGNEELSDEKRYCREKFIYDFELQNAIHKYGEPRECDKCQTTRYSDRFCERCISLHLQSLFNTW